MVNQKQKRRKKQQANKKGPKVKKFFKNSFEANFPYLYPLNTSENLNL